MRLALATAFIALATPALAAGQPFKCELSGNGKSVRGSIANPYAQETHCVVNCQFATSTGASFQISCAKTAAGGGIESELCVKTYDTGTLTKMTGGDGDCIAPLPPGEDNDDSDEDDEALIKQLQQQGQDMLKEMQRGK